ncbi:MAG TPA: TfoX/Sxy family protein [Candidatus Limnocylindrales bacterium]|jgi:TfoX/Sxy family transcriptional regulator of competence genes|nr:TfoX/Sxy family protein [Candidatus Limnocylindrales bacterium]
MPGFDKSPAALVERFDTVAGWFPDVERRLTFGYPCLYVGGNMVSGLHQSSWQVRLGDADLSKALALPGAHPFEPMPGRPMTGFVVLPAAVVDDDDAIRDWVGRAIAYGASRPAKTSKTKAKTPKSISTSAS